MNVNGMIKRLGGKTYTVTRANADGAYSTEDGTFVAGATVTVPVLGSVQPATPEDLVSVPDGDRTRERKRFYSQPALNTQDTAALRKGDVVDVDGQLFKVESVGHWANHGKSILVSVNSATN